MNTITTLLASLTIAGITMAAAGPNFTVNTKGSDQTRLTHNSRMLDEVGVVAHKVKDQCWLFFGTNGNYVLYFENDVNLYRGSELHVMGVHDGQCEALGQVYPFVQVTNFEEK
jgi:hypothetical protein